MKMKKICAAFVACLLLTSFNSIVSAVDVDNTITSRQNNITTSDSINRRFQYIVGNIPDISINNREATLDVNVNIVGGYSYEIIITLQRSTNQSSWTNVKTWPSITGTGTHHNTHTYNYSPLSPNLYYRVQSKVTIYNSNGSVLEESTRNSSAIRCS